MKNFLNYFVKITLRFLLHAYWLFPVRKNRITLLNDLSCSYADSMKYFEIYLQNTCPEKYEVVFPLANIDLAVSNGCPVERLITPKPKTAKYFYYVLTSKIIVTNAGGISFLPIRKKQKVISTWHGGGPYKKTGTDVYKDKWYKKEALLHSRNLYAIMSSCKYTTEDEFPSQLISKEKIRNTGMPRNDIFFERHPEIITKVHDYYREIYRLDATDKIALYAPTYRSNLNDRVDSAFLHFDIDLDYKRLLKNLAQQFGGRWRFMLRLHPRLKNIELDDKDIINATMYPDIQELLYVVDVCITDYSSLMWDFSFTKRPCFIYAKDLRQYEKERGFYMPSSKWPFPMALDNDEMERNIQSFNKEKYSEAVKNHHVESGSYETGTACESLLKLIQE